MPQKITAAEADQQQVVDQEDRLARDQRLDPPLRAQVVEPARRSARSSRRSRPRSGPAAARRPSRRRRRGSTRGSPSGPGRCRAAPARRWRTISDDVPDLEHAALLLDHDRVQEGGADQPRHQRGVLDRVPAPVAAPAELRVGPARAEQDPDREEDPGDQREAAGRRGSSSASRRRRDQRPDRERERDREERRSPSRASADGSSSPGGAAAG